ncbi:MAG: M48 family metallopeptidase [Chitinophagales bacterium]
MIFTGTYNDNAFNGGQKVEVELGIYSLKLKVVAHNGTVTEHIWQPEDLQAVTFNEWRNLKQPNTYLLISTPGFEEALKQKYPLSAFSSVKRKSGVSKFILALALVGFLFVIVPLLTYFFLLPVLADKAARAVPVNTEQKIGEQAYLQFTVGASINKDASVIANRFLNNLHFKSEYPVSITIINDSTVNAFALPGGRIVVYAGILHKMNSASQLAALLSHEYSHVVLKHSTRSLFRALSSYIMVSLFLGDATGVAAVVVQNADQLKQLSYSREFESDADKNGLQLLAEQHINPQGMISLFEALQKEEKQHGEFPGFLSTHPLTADRIAEIKAEINTKHFTIQQHPDLDSLFNELQTAVNTNATW